MRNIKLIAAYDGTDFAGWQRQLETRTVQGEIEGALARIHKHPVTLYGAGRTDAGVHAEGQCANFKSDIASMGAENFKNALNRLLPRDIAILSACEAPDDFHARFSAAARVYQYKIIAGRIAMPAERRYALVLRQKPRIDLMTEYAALLQGEMNLSLFSSPKDKSLSKSRFMNYVKLYGQDDGGGVKIIFEISASSFLWKMVRCIAGSFLFYADRGLSPKNVADLIAEGDHGKAGPTAPPEGLTLVRVDYPPPAPCRE
jgi:tRNA pseudouridine38-40 synthase